MMSIKEAGFTTIALVGLMGSGKSAVGRRVAELLEREFQDTDALIEAAAGRSIAEIFATDGEAAFRARERQLIAGLDEMPPSVLALGGGMFVGEENVTAICSAAFTIWLQATPATLRQRLGSDPGAVRPLLRGVEPEARLTELLAQRAPWYGRAHTTVAVDGLSIDAAASAVVAAAREAGRCG